MELLELAERCEAATGPDRELDAEIASTLGWANVGPGNRGGRCGRSPEGTWKTVPRYTASLDAAMTLVPEGWDWELEFIGGTSVANMLLARGTFNGAAQTPALALCAAALRAAQEMGK
jgi:hypothetical protein